ncbi:hypothetical protein JM66_00355 [Aeromonas bestiarum]|nr:hypothetical protein JM66_00355 [Aeromonas bestiarum]
MNDRIIGYAAILRAGLGIIISHFAAAPDGACRRGCQCPVDPIVSTMTPLTHIAGEMRPFIHTASRDRRSADVDLHY